MAETTGLDLSGLATPATSHFTSDPTAIIGQLLTLITQQQFPPREAGFLDVLDAFVQRANASPQALGQLASPQLQQQAQAIMQAMRGLSTGFGPFGGAQTNRLRAAALGSNTPLGTFVDPTLQAGENLAGFLGGESLILPQGQKSTRVNQPGYDPTQTALALQGLASLGLRGYGALSSGPQSETPGGLNYSGYDYGGFYGGNVDTGAF